MRRLPSWIVRGLLVGYMLLLIATSLLPSNRNAPDGWDRDIPPRTQDALHLPAYAGLAVLLSLTFVPTGWQNGRMLGILAGCCVVGAALEWAQSAIPGRVASLSDELMNAGGAMMGLVAMAGWYRIARGTRPE